MRDTGRPTKVLPTLCLTLALGTALGAGQAVAASIYTLAALLPIPASPDNSTGGKFTSYDIGDFDGTTQNYYLSDRSNVIAHPG